MEHHNLCGVPQSLFWIKNKKNRYTPVYPSFAILGFKGVHISRTSFPDDIVGGHIGSGQYFTKTSMASPPYSSGVLN